MRKLHKIWLIGAFLLASLTGISLYSLPEASAVDTCTTFTAPVRITAGGTYSGCIQSNASSTPAITIATAEPVVIQNATLRHKGPGIKSTTKGARVTVVNSKFLQINPGAVVEHRHIELTGASAVIIERNTFVDGDGIWIDNATVNPLTVRYNLAQNIGRYPHPTAGNCCVQFLQLSTITTSSGVIAWNHVRNESPSYIEDNINLWQSRGSDAQHAIDIHHNLIDGAYPSKATNTKFTGGGIMTGDGSGGNTLVRANVVVSTTNHGISGGGVGGSGDGIVITNNLLVNDTLGSNNAHYYSEFGQAIMGDQMNSSAIKGNWYNWKRDNTAEQFACWPSKICTDASNVRVTTTEDQARAIWESMRRKAGVAVGAS